MQASKKEKLLRTIGFFAVLITVLSILNYFFDPLRLDMVKYVTEHDSNYLSLMEEPEDSIDVLVLGDSLSYGMINPIDFWEKGGLTSYIAGQSGQIVPETYFELKNIMENQSPKVVIIETGILVHDFSTEMHILIYQVMYDLLPVTKYHELWKVMLGDTDDELKEHFKGFRKREDIMAYEGGEYMIYTDEDKEIKGIGKTYMKKIKELCDDNNATLVLVSMPSPKNYNYEIHNGLTELADELGVEYIDFNLMTEELSFDWTAHMLDGDDHVNFFGTLRTSGWLLDYIINNYNFEKRTDEKLIEDWNNETDKYKEFFNLQ
ncbi:MAG: hypothetical protein IJ054_05705 [Lachnospiraceae bacterium]|nr:hypothetical protein [Lachnospiraceae bacterium]MBQ9232621.1 hypothetical protein [Lachnospiraceae bacterium]